jgi:hypothetical protein
MVSYNGDYLQLIATGDVQPEVIDLMMEGGTSLARIASEASPSLFLLRLATHHEATW